MKNLKLIDALLDCVKHCNFCANACLEVDDISMMVNCIKTDRVCAEICSTTANILTTNYKDVDELVAYCKKICITCAEECEQHSHQHCKDCAEACRKCAEACSNFLN